MKLEKFLIQGGNALHGTVTISGAKNAAVAILPATVLAEGPCIIENIPAISDIAIITKILYEMGAQIEMLDKTTLKIDTRYLNTCEVPYEMARNMRASYYFLGALLGRYKTAKVVMPGGCDFGVRPIDQHIKGFEALGANVDLRLGVIEANAEELVGNKVNLDVVSVGATINVMLAAVKAQGLTVIDNAAKEPHIVDLANFLNSMGADIRGAGTDVIKIVGVPKLGGTTYSIIPDQIEAGTYMIAAAATGGDVLIKGVIPKHLESVSDKLMQVGAVVVEYDDSIRVSRTQPIQKTNIKTKPHPGFPTDLQPQMTAMLAIAEGTSVITEGVWDNRFKYVDELSRMGARIQVDGRVAVVEGCGGLAAAPVKSVDLRAGAAMMIAGLIASGTTTIEDIHHIERGYEGIDEKLVALGADIRKVTDKKRSPLMAL